MDQSILPVALPVIQRELGSNSTALQWTVNSYLLTTAIFVLLGGKLCDRLGPRKTAVRLLLVGSIPVLLAGLATDYTSFLLFRLAIGVIGGSFVITQFHTSMMFASNIKGTANAVTGGWGNLGGGVTNMVMPIIFSAIVGFGYAPHMAWRYAMIVPAVMMWIVAFLYYKYTTDTPARNYSEVGNPAAANGSAGLTGSAASRSTDWSVLADWRIAALTMAYAMCFGMEITFDNVASLHFVDTFHLS